MAIDLTNRPEYLETFYAALLLGAVPVNVNFRYTASELRYLLDNSDAKAIVHGPEFAVAGGRRRSGSSSRRGRRCGSRRAVPTSRHWRHRRPASGRRDRAER